MKKLINNFSSAYKFTLLTVIALMSTNISYSQDFGADLVSSYVWRGTQFGSGAHIQPYMELGSGNFTAGVWGSFPTSAKGGGNELDLYLGYDFGPVALTVTSASFDQFMVQLASVGIVGLFCVFGATLITLFVKSTLGLRVSDEEEEAGLDIAEHGTKAYFSS
jgi:ammonia channel protein AmtB